MRDPIAERPNPRWAISLLGGFVFPPILGFIGFELPAQVGQVVVFLSFTGGLVCAGLAPVSTPVRVLLTLPYIVVMGLCLFILDIVAACGFHGSCP
ncbi:MAG TPA: hypothetical protein VKT78_18150 [Fimbriimonadaceae bacterium]|nr:hypothetical protein [Fimbriimonadaceae bacterium]